MCREWRRVSEMPSLWQMVCKAVFGPPLRLYKALSWKDVRSGFHCRVLRPELIPSRRNSCMTPIFGTTASTVFR